MVMENGETQLRKGPDWFCVSAPDGSVSVRAGDGVFHVLVESPFERTSLSCGSVEQAMMAAIEGLARIRNIKKEILHIKEHRKNGKEIRTAGNKSRQHHGH